MLGGDNFAHLLAIRDALQGSIDLIYLDPPYNCGYRLAAYRDDTRDAVSEQWLSRAIGGGGGELDQRRRWLSLLYGRLLLLPPLLSARGVVVVSIDSCEIATVSLLLDEVLGPGRSTVTYCWPHAEQPHGRRYVWQRMNYLLVSAPGSRRLDAGLPVDVVGSTQQARGELERDLGEGAVFDTPKTIGLIQHLIGWFAWPDSVILDPYAGAGSTVLAAESLNRLDGGGRACVVMEASQPTLELMCARLRSQGCAYDRWTMSSCDIVTT